MTIPKQGDKIKVVYRGGGVLKFGEILTIEKYNYKSRVIDFEGDQIMKGWIYPDNDFFELVQTIKLKDAKIGQIIQHIKSGRKFKVVESSKNMCYVTNISTKEICDFSPIVGSVHCPNNNRSRDGVDCICNGKIFVKIK